MDCSAYQELVAGHIDSELGPQQRREADGHVAACRSCATLRARHEGIRSVVRFHAPRYSVPEDLRARIETALPGSDEAPASEPRVARRLVLAGAIAATLALVIGNPFRAPAPDLLATLASDVHAAHAEEIPLAIRASDPESLRKYYRGSGRIPFDQTVEDFSAVGLRPVGGRVGELGAVPTTVTVYEGHGGKVVCRRFRAGSVELPLGGERVGDATVYTVEDVTVRVQRIDGVICALASAMPRDAFIRTLLGSKHTH